MLKNLLKSKKKTDHSDENSSSEAKPKLLGRLFSGLGKTRQNLGGGLGRLFRGKKHIDQELLDDIEMMLISADVGAKVSADLLEQLQQRLKRKELADSEAVLNALKTDMTAILQPVAHTLEIDDTHQPFVILMVGINGAGKTTTIGKLAKQLQKQGKSVMLAAGDTFRAAAVEQLQVWGERNDIPVIAQHSGSDSAAVAYDALQSAKARNCDVLIIDTAGRLHTQDHLMAELEKIKRVINKLDESAPHEVLLVLDGSIGQNAMVQAEQFKQTVAVSGICMTKLDGTAKGGIVFAIADKFKIPLRFIGVGEQIDDLQPFVAEDFVEALFAEDEE